MSTERLHQLPLFASIKHEVVDQMTRDLPRKLFKKGDLIIQQGNRDLKAYILVEGKLGVYAESKDGIRTAVMFHRAPFVVGVLEIWRERPALGSIVAIEPCSVIVLTKKDFLRLVQSSHQFCINLLQIISNLSYKMAKERRIRLFGRVEHLVANTLCSFAQLYGEEHHYGVLVRKEVNKSEIADILGVARRSVIRAIEQLEEEELIQLSGSPGRRELVIPDLEALRAKAQETLLPA